MNLTCRRFHLRIDRWPSSLGWIRIAILQPAVVYAYVCAPRAVLSLLAPSSELSLVRGVLDRRLAYVAVLLCGYHLLRGLFPTAIRRLLIAWLHVDFAAGCVEAGALYAIGVGYSPLFFYHVGWEAARLALSQFWPHIIVMVAMMATADCALRRVLPDAAPWATQAGPQRLALAFVVLFGIRSVDMLYRHGVAEEIAPLALALNWASYLEDRRTFDRLTLDTNELRYLRELGIGGFGRRQRVRAAAPPLNLVTIYLEGFQANFSEAWQSPLAGLTPNLDRFASRFIRFENFYNAVTPTINALISSQCGILSGIENAALSVDRGYTRNLRCLSDRLHDAGYYQVFLGGADSGFSGKRLFLEAHQYDEVVGWEQWRGRLAYSGDRRNDWGLHDTDLVREAIARLPALRKQGPFHLTILTVNTHPPGFVAPDCHEVLPGKTMLAAIHCTDQAIGMLLDSLEREGYLNDTAVVIMGDHTMFPSSENVDALGPVAEGWFGRVYMAVSYPQATPRLIRTSSYTPDFAAVVLDALQFRPVPRFPFGHSALGTPDRSRTLVARHFEVLDGRMIPPIPDLSERCDLVALEQTKIDGTDGSLSPCERRKIVDLVEKATMSGGGLQINTVATR